MRKNLGFFRATWMPLTQLSKLTLWLYTADMVGVDAGSLHGGGLGFEQTYQIFSC